MSSEQIWSAALAYIKNEINSAVGYNTYIKDITPISYDGTTFVAGVSTSICKNMIDIRYTDIIEKSISRITASQVKLNIVLKDEYKEPEIKEEKIEQKNTNTRTNNLFPRYTFDNFVVGTSNEMATAVSMSAAKYPGQENNNPIFLYGPSGLGKTHLMQAIGNEILKNSPDKNVVYVTSERFTNDMIESIQQKNMGTFRQLYRNVDVLLVDDIQFIENKQGTQEEFFHTFNDLYLNNKQIVITSDRPVKELVTIEERLRTRFEWGQVLDINKPDYETRVAILKKKAGSQNIYVSEEVLAYIAEQIDSNVRELEGALLKIISYAGIKNSPINMEIAEIAIRSILPEDGIVKVTPKKVIECVCSFYKISEDELLGKTKEKNIAFPRQIAMYLCKTLTNLNFVMIGKALGNRERTTVMYGVDKIMEMLKTDNILKADIDAITKDINTI